MKTKKKGFDALEMKRKAQERIYEVIKDMTMEEELAYWNGIHKKLIAEQQRMRERLAMKTPRGRGRKTDVAA